MEGLQITAPGVISTTEKKEIFENDSSVKVKITKTLLIQEDFVTFCGDHRVNYPIIPGRVGIGKVIETSQGNDFGFERGMSVFIHPVTNCNKCFECAKGDFKRCASFNVAGKNVDGFLRDFAICDNEYVSILPSSVDETSALFLDHVAISDRIVDAINLQKGEHVVIVGGDVLGIILAQLIIYYQGVPILVDNNNKNLELAKNAGVYYTLFADNKIEKSVAELTGARLSSKVVYMTGANLNTDIALKLAGNNATICLAGFGCPNIRVNFNTALLKQLNFNCVTNGFGRYDSAINVLANKAIDTSVFNIKTVKSEQTISAINELGKNISYNACESMLVVENDKL